MNKCKCNENQWEQIKLPFHIVVVLILLNFSENKTSYLHFASQVNLDLRMLLHCMENKMQRLRIIIIFCLCHV